MRRGSTRCVGPRCAFSVFRSTPPIAPVLDLSLFLGQLVVVLSVALIVGRIVRGLGQPRVIGEMIAGVALGPSLFGSIAPQVSNQLFPPTHMLALNAVSQTGVVLFMFVVGCRIDLDVLRARAMVAVAVSNASLVLPMLMGAGLAVLLYPSLAGRDAAGAPVALLPFALFIGTAMSVTAFPVLARILDERGMTSTRMGSVAIASAAIGDVTAWCILAAVVAIARAGDALSIITFTIAKVVAFALLLVVVGRRVLAALDERRLAGNDAAKAPVSAEVIGAALVFALACAFVTERIGVHAVFGAFAAGAILPRASGLAAAIADALETIVSTLFLPIFFAYSGLRTQIGLLDSPALWGTCAVVITVAIAGKFGGATVAARMTAMSWRDSIGIGILMNTRGLMELVVLNVGLELGVISRTMFAIMVVMALVTTVMTSPLLMLVSRRRENELELTR